jgi:hypothetical protein
MTQTNFTGIADWRISSGQDYEMVGFAVWASSPVLYFGYQIVNPKNKIK